ncbi:bifunctional diguanylate cyclase/phosphodiesterase [Alteromonas gilva]|uniref:EAL domain-containing protein n=1 Tax=Alteromonas gilva TaxID=2987522 RepID=A0ABT5KYF9_9ALTE|nr:EAL domain-containing protein [Alteromonas gilva]MDC8829814.1 EAL domain-containing protein [Alteromonas gilva]
MKHTARLTKRYSRARFSLIVNSLLSVTLLVVLALLGEYFWAERNKQANIKEVSEQLYEYRAAVEYLVNQNLELTQGIAAYISLHPELSQQEYSNFAAQLMQGQHQVKNISGAREMVITHMYPLSGNEKALGLDYRDSPEEIEVVLKAIELNTTVLAGPVKLVQGGTGLIARKPVFINATGELWGLVSVVLDYPAIMAASGIYRQQTLNIAIRRETAPGRKGEVFAGAAAIFESSPVRMSVQLPGGSWVMAAEPKQGWNQFVVHYPIWLTALLLVIVLLGLLHRRYRNQAFFNQSVTNLIESEAKFRTIFHGHNAVMLLIEKESGQIVDANDAAVQYYGYSHAQLTSKKIHHINQLDPEEVKALRAKAANNQDNFFVFPHKLASGQIRQVEVHSSPVTVQGITLLFSIIHDITQRIENEQRLRLDAKVFEHSQEGVLITDAHLKIISVNKAFTDITGYQEEEVVGRSPRFLSANKNKPELFELIKASILRDGFWKGEVWSRKKDGTVFPELLSISKLEEPSGEITHFVAVLSDISKIKQSEERLEHLAHYDTLTDLPNRLLLKSRIEHAESRTKRHSEDKIALLFLDLDQFKLVNDSLGHMMGDELLKQVATRLTSIIREDDTVSRLGGDEFVILLEEVRKVEDLEKVAQSILQCMNQPFSLHGKEAFVSVSIGIAVYPNDTRDAGQLLTFADAAMYKAKQSGRNCYAFYTDAITKLADRKLKIANELKKAIQNDELELYYQPQINLLTQQIVGAEALIRWHHPEEGLLAPNAFIGIAEESGIIHELSKWVLRKGCQQLKKWQDNKLNISLSLNVSSKDFNFPDFITDIGALIEEHAIQTQFLELELTETAIMEHPQQALFTLTQIREMGVSVAVDDFGIGHSAIAYLKKFPVTKLKIDRSFIHELESDESNRTLVATIINLAKSFDLSVVAEGIEIAAHEQVLIELGCDIGQGYLYSKPVPCAEFEQLLGTVNPCHVD